MRRLHAGHWLGLALFFAVPLASVAPKGEVVLVALAALPLLARNISQGFYLQIPRSLTAIVLALMVLWGCATALWALEPSAALQRGGSLALLAAAAVSILLACDNLVAEERKLARWATVAGLAVGCLLLIIELSVDLPINSMVRGAENVTKAAILNSALSMVAIMAWPTALILKQQNKLWFAVGVLLLAVTVLLLGDGNSARIAFGVAALVATVTLLWPDMSRRAMVIIATLGIATAPLLPSTFLSPDDWKDALSGTTDSAIHRLHIWHFSAERIFEKPIAGWGLDASRTIPGGDVEVIQDGASMQLHPHNAPLQIWLELGILGAAGLAAIVTIALLSVRNLPREAQAASLATTTAALVIASLSFGIWQHWWLATLALAAVAVKIAVVHPEPG
jgi:exopolysaccharide production protein ExoQ